MKVLLVEEYATRERLSLLFLERSLRRRGHSVLLSNIWQLQEDFRRFRPDVVVDNISDSVAHYAGKLAMLGDRHRNVNLIWEQILCPWNVPRYRFADIMGSHFVDARVSWGSVFKSLLLAENPSMDPSRIWTTGAPNQSVAHQARSAPREAVRLALDHPFGEYERAIVFAESFGAAELDLERLRTRNADQRSPYVYEWGLYSRKMVSLFSESIERLAKRCPSFLFILRLHPGKSLNYYHQYAPLTDLENVRFDRSGSIIPLIRAADLMIAGKSGTLADAYFCGTPSVQLLETDLPFAPTNILSVAVEKFGRAITPEELWDVQLDSIMRDTVDDGAMETLVSDWFGDVESDVFERVAEMIEVAFERKGVPKGIPAREYKSVGVVRRRLRNAAKVRGLGVRSAPPDDYPYDRLFELLCDTVPTRRAPGMNG